MDVHEQCCRLALSRVEGIGPVKYRLLMEACGTAANLFSMSAYTLRQLPGMNERTALAIRQFRDWFAIEAELALCAQQGIQVLFLGEPNYPARLLLCDDAPPVLFFKGKGCSNPPRSVAIIGTRRATEYGRQLCTDLVAGLAQRNICVVSGMAYGIDIAAHKACVQFGVPTLGVLAHGLGNLYPPEHHATASAMQHRGGLLSTYFHDVLPEKGHFPARNRVVAGMVDAVVVVETGPRGGSLITARMAEAYHRDVFCFPGRVNDAQSSGCLMLLKQLKAGLICAASDLLYNMQWLDEEAPVQQLPLFNEALPPHEEAVLLILKEFGPLPVDELQQRLGWESAPLSSLLLLWELHGRIYWMPGKRVALR